MTVIDLTANSGRPYVAGHKGLVGSAITRKLLDLDCDVLVASKAQLDLRDQATVNRWFDINRPSTVYLAAGTVGGILANSTRPAEFLYDNMMIHANVIEAARRSGVDKLLYLGSSCIYPRDTAQPIQESALLGGQLEPTNEPYAIAKIAGIKMCQAYRKQYGCNFISAMPTNLYGPGDNFDLESSHVVPALLRKFHEARLVGAESVEIWGSGTPMREFLHVDDLADACIHLMRTYEDAEHVNVGTGRDMTIRQLAELIREIVYPTANISFDPTRPDGTPRKVLDVSRLNESGWHPRIQIKDGLRDTYNWFASTLAVGAGPRV